MSTPDSPDLDPGAPASATVTVGFPIIRELLKFPPHLVRPRRDYVDGAWVPSRAAIVVRPDRPVEIYGVGDKIELESHRDFYGSYLSPATVVRVVDDLSYVVAYSASEGKATAYVHCQFMRKPPNNSNGNQRRKVGAKIKRTERRQSMSGESPSSPVDVASSGDEHSHDPESSATKRQGKIWRS